MSEACLDSATPKNLLKIEVFNLARADHLNNVKRIGVCIYYKESLPVQAINLPYFNDALLLEISLNNKKMIASVIYCFPSQQTDKSDLFLSNFEKLIFDIKNRKPYLFVITGDFNGRSSSWWSNDMDTTKKTKLFAQVSSDGL